MYICIIMYYIYIKLSNTADLYVYHLLYIIASLYTCTRIMMVYLQLLSETVANGVQIVLGEEVSETVRFVQMMDTFDSLNVNNFTTGKRRRKVFQDPYRGTGDFRLKVCACVHMCMLVTTFYLRFTEREQFHHGKTKKESVPRPVQRNRRFSFEGVYTCACLTRLFISAFICLCSNLFSG